MTRIIGILSGKGGVGKTTIAINLAVLLKEFKKKVLLIDCNLGTPHLAYYLGANNYKHTLNDVLSRKVSMSSALNYYNGIRFLPSSVYLKDLLNINSKILESELRKTLNEKKFDYVIIDSAPGIGKEVMMVLKVVDEVIFVVTPFIPVISDVLRTRDIISRINGRIKMSIIANMMARKPYELSIEAIEKITGLPVLGSIPFDRKVFECLALKLPVVISEPKSSFSIHLRKIVCKILGKKYKESLKDKISSFFEKFKRRFQFYPSLELEEIKEELFIPSF